MSRWCLRCSQGMYQGRGFCSAGCEPDERYFERKACKRARKHRHLTSAAASSSHALPPPPPQPSTTRLAILEPWHALPAPPPPRLHRGSITRLLDHPCIQVKLGALEDLFVSRMMRVAIRKLRLLTVALQAIENESLAQQSRPKPRPWLELAPR